MSVTIEVADETETAGLGAAIAHTLRPGDRVGLIGDLGAGKTTLARTILRTLARDDALEVPSPSFTLVQEYALDPPVRHVDLYRVEDGGALDELGLDEGDAVELVEWPRGPMPIELGFAFGPDDDARTITIEAPADWLARLERERLKAGFLTRAGWAEAIRTPLVQDASTRNYERLRGEGTAVLMDAPVASLEPGSYAARAGLTHGNLGAFLAVGRTLQGRGLSVPDVLAADQRDGFLLLEDFGDKTIAPGGIPVPERYAAAIEALAHHHRRAITVPLEGDPPHAPAYFDAALATAEVGEFCRWFLGVEPPQEFRELWSEAIESLAREDDTLALRDVHSPNLFWLAERSGIERVGFIDFQDAFVAPAAYDVASLVQDARVDVPNDLQQGLIARYLAARPGLVAHDFMRSYRVLGAQRATKILGIFRRLALRDGKSNYLAHLPRMSRLLQANLDAEPALARLKAWFAEHGALREAA